MKQIPKEIFSDLQIKLWKIIQKAFFIPVVIWIVIFTNPSIYEKMVE